MLPWFSAFCSCHAEDELLQGNASSLAIYHAGEVTEPVAQDTDKRIALVNDATKADDKTEETTVEMSSRSQGLQPTDAHEESETSTALNSSESDGFQEILSPEPTIEESSDVPAMKPASKEDEPIKSALPAKTNAKAQAKTKVKVKPTPKKKPKLEQSDSKMTKPSSKSVAYDELGRRLDWLQAANKRNEDLSSSDDDLDDADLCPSSRKQVAFERELKNMKKKMREGCTDEQRDEMDNPWLHTQISEGERDLKKDLFKSFYREQYARLKSQAQPDMKQYEKKDPATGNVVPSQNLTAEGGHRPMPRPKGVDLPKDFRKPIGRLAPVQLLKQHSCKSKRKLVSVFGDLFDVSDRPDKYGPDGPYWYMTGRDITWGLVCGDDSEENIDKFYDLFKIQPKEAADKRLQGLISWWCFYEKEYGKPVGRNTAYDKEWGLAAPPNTGEACTIM
eukprot:TRINITY_DN88445_c0_g1_i1.p1 TRINITY_DN88445_c0_g1~~TRINITY_DN88445_c0_g1_i1.p1  ORF type:complete len:448 (+),score=90.57 TRINITY_DN88445_c0_g1_i1:54-1397(+)